MSIVRPRLRFHLEHQTAPAWPSEAVTYDEAERHLRKLTRTACGCMRYGTLISRPFARITMASGLCAETNIARLFLTMSADRPLNGTDFACHQCDDRRCANPDHLLVGTHMSNIRDKFRRGRPIRERLFARWFDPLLEQIPEAAPRPLVVGSGVEKSIGFRPLSELPARSKPLYAFVRGFERDKARKVDADTFYAPCTSKVLPAFSL